MKKLLRILTFFSIALAFTAISLPHLAAADSTALMAGRNADIGDVYVWNNGTYLYVTYEISDTRWCMTETHLHVATSLADIPQTNKGNPIPGRFRYKGFFENGCAGEYMFIISLAGLKTSPLYIAAHASVSNGETHENEGAWAAGEEFPGRNWATYFIYNLKSVIIPR